jgi:dihydrofolate synthase/folylpolyglutamate synthase
MPPELTPSTLNDWLALLEQRHPIAIDMGLDRVNEVLQRMALDFSSTRIISIAGTNGKGSTATLCAALLQAHGASVGLYTSPHLLNFRERIMVNDQWVTEEALLAAFAQVERARAETSLTYFEFTTLAAYQVFVSAGVSWCVMEVGLGGRLDAVNAVSADVSVVTSIGLDHTDWLGDTLAKIAVEKAGIARAGRPLIVAPTPVDECFVRVADQVGARLIQPGWAQQLDATHWSPTAPHPLAATPLPMPKLPLNSAHLALHALHQAQVTLNPQRVAQVIRQTQMLGRMQSLTWRGLPVWLDVAHNEAAARWVAQRLPQLGPRWSIILGMRQDKDVAAVVDSLQAVNPYWILIDLSGQPQGLSADEIQQRSALQDVAVARSMLEALELAQQQQQATLICGSFLTITAALEVMHIQDHHE